MNYIMKEDTIEIAADEIVFKMKDGGEVRYPLGTVKEEDGELIPDQHFKTPVNFHLDNKTVVFNWAGKEVNLGVTDNSIILMGKVAEKLDEPIEG